MPILDKPPLMRAVTGLETPEDEALVPQSQAQWNQRQAQRAVARQRCQRAPVAGRKGVLASERHKLLFIWFYFRVYPTQDMMAAVFGLSQSRVYEWAEHVLSGVKRSPDCKGRVSERETGLRGSGTGSGVRAAQLSGGLPGCPNDDVST